MSTVPIIIPRVNSDGGFASHRPSSSRTVSNKRSSCTKIGPQLLCQPFAIFNRFDAINHSPSPRRRECQCAHWKIVAILWNNGTMTLTAPARLVVESGKLVCPDFSQNNAGGILPPEKIRRSAGYVSRFFLNIFRFYQMTVFFVLPISPVPRCNRKSLSGIVYQHPPPGS